MKFLYKWLRNKYENENRLPDLVSKSERLVTGRSDDIRSNPLMFKLYKANGGWAIEFVEYNQKTDRHETSLHVVNESDDLGNEISKIITYELLRK